MYSVMTPRLACIVPAYNLTIKYLVLKHKKGLRQQLGQQQPSLQGFLLRANTTTPGVDNTDWLFSSMRLPIQLYT